MIAHALAPVRPHPNVSPAVAPDVTAVQMTIFQATRDRPARSAG